MSRFSCNCLQRIMEIRPAATKDIPDIVSLLKLSLGDSLLPKSATYWIWKHIENPFGASPVLLAFEGAQLIGIRSFMRWNWKNDSVNVEAVRAVDTAIHPDYQGKGIFSKLTLSLLDHCKSLGLQMVYNTPNEKSKPGYLKMGWQEAGKLPVAISVVNPMSVGVNFLLKSDKDRDNSENSANKLSYFLHHPGLSQLIKDHERNLGNQFTTAHTVESLRWRYEQVPVVTYYADGIEGAGLQALFIYRIKTSRLGKELRITDVFSGSSTTTDSLNFLIQEKIRLHKPDFVTWSSLAKAPLKHIFTFSSHSMGPMVTVRSIALPSSDSFSDFKAWSPSIGDLELF
jgi:GNAT superfamily N-acetyltransferase